MNLSKKPKKTYRMLCATCDKPIPAGPDGRYATVSFPEDRPYNHKRLGYDCDKCSKLPKPLPPRPPLLSNLSEIEAAQEEIRVKQALINESIADLKMHNEGSRLVKLDGLVEPAPVEPEPLDDERRDVLRSVFEPPPAAPAEPDEPLMGGT